MPTGIYSKWLLFYLYIKKDKMSNGPILVETVTDEQ